MTSTSAQLAPSVVRMTYDSPLSGSVPIAQPCVASTKLTPVRSTDETSVGSACTVHVSPASAVVMIVPDLPTAQPAVALPNETLASGSSVPVTRAAFHVVPPSLVRHARA